MNRLSESMMKAWIGLGARYLPFADAATAEVPLSRLLRLSLFQVSAGMTLVLLVGTLNRVMIVELGVPASLVAVMLALPLIFAPLRALIGFKSDIHRSELGWKRVPFIYRGSMVQFGGLAIMPFALLVLAHQGESASLPAWVGQAAAGLITSAVAFGRAIAQHGRQASCLAGIGQDVERAFVSGGDKHAADINDDNELVINNANRGIRFGNGECRY